MKIARTYVKIISVRVERLQDITDEDAIREGIKKLTGSDSPNCIYENYSKKGYMWLTARDSFASLINKINGKGTWEKNPWVFRYEFQLVKNENK